jgi:hypothetical protein
MICYWHTRVTAPAFAKTKQAKSGKRIPHHLLLLTYPLEEAAALPPAAVLPLPLAGNLLYCLLLLLLPGPGPPPR